MQKLISLLFNSQQCTLSQTQVRAVKRNSTVNKPCLGPGKHSNKGLPCLHLQTWAGAALTNSILTLIITCLQEDLVGFKPKPLAFGQQHELD